MLDLKDCLGSLAATLTSPILEISPTYQKHTLTGFTVCETLPAPSRIMVRLAPDESNQLPRAEIAKFITADPNGRTTTADPKFCIPDRIGQLNLISTLANIALDSEAAQAWNDN